MRIVVDVMGGDRGPEVVVHGAKLALEANSRISELHFVGNEAEINSAMGKLELKDSRIRIVHASQVLTMEDKPIDGLRKKKDCSILRAVDLRASPRSKPDSTRRANSKLIRPNSPNTPPSGSPRAMVGMAGYDHNWLRPGRRARSIGALPFSCS